MAKYRRLLENIPPKVEDQLVRELMRLMEEYPSYSVGQLKMKMLADRQIALQGLKTGSCWCGVGIGNPMYKGHTETCKLVQRLMLEEQATRGKNK